MNRSSLLLVTLLTLFSLNSHSECTKLVDVINLAAQNNGLVFPIDREHVIKLYHLRIIPFEVLNSDAHFYIEDRNQPLVRLFTTENGCTSLQWMIPRDFLPLIGIQRTLT